jgi:FkbM family methyltransferase
MKALRQLAWSLKLDYELLVAVERLAALDKLRFIAVKYLQFVLRKLMSARSQASVTGVFGNNYSFTDPHGLASLQRVYCAHAHLLRYLPRHPVVVDVGANIGQFNFFSRNYLKASRIISIEPVRESFELLRRNALDDQDCLCCAVAKEEGEVLFHINHESSQLSSYIAEDGTSPSRSINIPARRLDALIQGLGLTRVDLLKIDTEGSEYDILQSAEQLLSLTGMVLVEMSVFRKASGNLFKVGTFLEERGFTLVELSGVKGPNPSDLDAVFIRS